MIKTYKEALEKIFTYEETRDYSLDKIIKAMDYFWNPLKDIKVIHIAWTNWKWSTSRMVYSVLRKAWYSVWSYNQPHLVDIRERFLVDEELISKKYFVNILNKLLNLPFELSYFEKTTMIAFLYFEYKKVDFAIVEVWFWGLLDSTNVVSPIITAITSIWFDHMKTLGNTLEEISFQKAWIIKDKIPIVYNHKNDVIKDIAIKKSSPIIFASKNVETNLRWDYQKKNAQIAYEICKFLKVKEKIILEWLMEVNHPWRLQSITNNLIIDWAHNIDWLRELEKYNKNNFVWKWEKINYCFSLKHWKTPENILKVFWKDKRYILVDSSHNILEKNENIEKYLDENNVSYKRMTPRKIYNLSKKEKNSLFLVFWSLYMIWEFLRFKN